MELGLTQEALAERVGEAVRQSEISRLELGYVSLPRRSRLEAIARALEVTPGYLLVASGWIEAGVTPDAIRPSAGTGGSVTEPAPPTHHEHTLPEEISPAAHTAEERQSGAQEDTRLRSVIARSREVSLQTSEILRQSQNVLEKARRPRRPTT